MRCLMVRIWGERKSASGFKLLVLKEKAVWAADL